MRKRKQGEIVKINNSYSKMHSAKWLHGCYPLICFLTFRESPNTCNLEMPLPIASNNRSFNAINSA